MSERRPTLISLDAQLAALGNPKTPGAMLALPIAAESENRLLRGPEGQAGLLIAGACTFGPDIKLRNVEARVGVRCMVEAPGGVTREITGTLISCTSADHQLRRLFLGVMEDALDTLGSKPTPAAIAGWLQRIASLFARLEQEGRKRLQGLWAELIVMIALENHVLAARRWHTDPNERFDFFAGTFGLEVKSCQDLERVHHFSLNQLRPPGDLNVWVASVVVRPDPQGQSVLDLLHELEVAIPDAAIRGNLRTMVMASGGIALQDDALHHFDTSLALSTLRMFDVRDVPSLSGELPQEVLAVKLEVRCRDLAPVGEICDAQIRLAGEGD